MCRGRIKLRGPHGTGTHYWNKLDDLFELQLHGGNQLYQLFYPELEVVFDAISNRLYKLPLVCISFLNATDE